MAKNIKPAYTGFSALPAMADDGFAHYVREIQRFPILTADQELAFAQKWRDTQDRAAGEALVTSHLRMVVSEAYNFANYGIALGDLVAAGNIGLMQALQKFDPERGFRFSTYAMWWIRAEMYETVLSNWSLVKIGTSANQKKVFFNLSRAKRALGIMDGTMSASQIADIAKYLDVRAEDVETMSTRLMIRDASLNTATYDDSEAEASDNLADNSESIQDILETREFKRRGAELLKKHLAELPERDREILIARRLVSPPQTLEELSQKLGVSRERVRQLEDRAYENLKKAILNDEN